MLDADRKTQIVKLLDERLRKFGQETKCPMCGNTHFAISDSYFQNVLQDDINTTTLGGPSVPTIAIICTNCGFVSQHALGILGLLPSEGDADGKK
jgi:hypothetical protein